MQEGFYQNEHNRLLRLQDNVFAPSEQKQKASSTEGGLLASNRLKGLRQDLPEALTKDATYIFSSSTSFFDY